jgi:hypothetical protein
LAAAALQRRQIAIADLLFSALYCASSMALRNTTATHWQGADELCAQSSSGLNPSSSQWSIARRMVDHIVALRAGGRDEVANLERRTREDHALETTFDMVRCRLKRKAATEY